MPGGTLNVASGVQTIDALLGLRKWSGLSVSYNFPTTADYYPATYFTDGSPPSPAILDFATFEAAPPSLQAAIETAITSELMAVSNLVYTEADPADANADSSFARADLADDPELGAPPGGSGYYPGMVDRGGDGWFNVTQDRFLDIQVGDSAYYVVLHELGHTVGLKHGHANDRPGPTTDLLPDEWDSFEFSVMTYHRYIGAPDVPVAGDTQADSFPQSLMMLDIAAIQYMYGANFDTNSGDTVYTFSPTTGEMSVDGIGQGLPSGNRIFRTIWDGNGIDTYDLSNYTTDLEIDLAPGGWSNFHSGQRALLHIGDPMTADDNIWARGNVFNALQYQDNPSSLIENATGGSGDDTIHGNSANNILIGNVGTDALFGLEGSDTLFGGAGDDVLDGGPGADSMSGGAGFDFVTYESATEGAVANLESVASFMGGAAAGDKFSGIEGLIGSPFTDVLIGHDGDNELRGGAGDDILAGLRGNDRIEGGAGNDGLLGGPGSDTFFFAPGFGNDTIVDWQDGNPRLRTQDYISFEGQGLSMADLVIVYGFGSATVSVGRGVDSIHVLGATFGSLSAEDFIF